MNRFFKLEDDKGKKVKMLIWGIGIVAVCSATLLFVHAVTTRTITAPDFSDWGNNVVYDSSGANIENEQSNDKQDRKLEEDSRMEKEREQQVEFANWLETDLLWRRYNIEGYDLVLYSYWFKSGQYMVSRAVISSDYDKDFEDYEQHGPYKYSIKGNIVYNGDDNIFFEIDMSRNYIVIGGEKYYRGADAAMSAFKKEL